MKTCHRCRVARPLEEFRLVTGKLGKQYATPYRENRCRECERVRSREYHQRNRKKSRAASRKNKLRIFYGITPEQYEVMLRDQNNRCKICGKSDPGGRGAFHVDHDHKTKTIRGLLCHGCNVGLGSLQDSVDILTKAMEYLNAAR